MLVIDLGNRKFMRDAAYWRFRCLYGGSAAVGLVVPFGVQPERIAGVPESRRPSSAEAHLKCRHHHSRMASKRARRWLGRGYDPEYPCRWGATLPSALITGGTASPLRLVPCCPPTGRSGTASPRRLNFSTGRGGRGVLPSVFPKSRIIDVARHGEVGPGPGRSVVTVRFELAGNEFSGFQPRRWGVTFSARASSCSTSLLSGVRMYASTWSISVAIRLSWSTTSSASPIE
jgi:hypothetical protein